MQVNLARKWRSRRFEELVGQSLVVRTLKNSLYRNLIFPVYLFSGTRGCGKTSVARIFASAINCEQNGDFRSNPQDITLPCLQCKSCKAMLALNHPDFIEIDAASHTGVDNIRQISEAASFVPAISQKKIYLIDEAHMLSKAAFNAFLKLLEEPPSTACFILATTEVSKIPSTVRSRCLQLFFYPVNNKELMQHLAFVCDQEKLSYEREALLAIAVESEGSVRDALNLIERIRLISTKITLNAVSKVLGSISNYNLVNLMKLLLKQQDEELFKSLDEELLKVNDSIYFFRKISQLVLLIMSIKKKLVPCKDSEIFSDFLVYIDDELFELVANYSLKTFIEFIDLVVRYESLLVKTIQWHLIIKVLFLKFLNCLKDEIDFNKPTNASKAPEKSTININRDIKKNSDNLEGNITSNITPSFELPDDKNSIANFNSDIKLENLSNNSEKIENSKILDSNAVSKKNITFSEFTKRLREENVLVSSIFSQVMDIKLIGNQLELAFSAHLSFYKDTIDQSKSLWEPLIKEYYKNDTIEVVLLFNKNIGNNDLQKKNNSKPSLEITKENIIRTTFEKSTSSVKKTDKNIQLVDNRAMFLKNDLKFKGYKFDIKGKEGEFKFTNLLLEIFPGTIRILDA